LCGATRPDYVRFAAETFRRSCEALADHWSSRTACPPRGV
jgi:hypothetical protein